MENFENFIPENNLLDDEKNNFLNMEQQVKDVEKNDGVMPKKVYISEDKQKKTKVYAKINDEGYIIEVLSDVFLENTDGWTVIDEGIGDKFVHAQSCYFDEPLVDEFGKFRYKI